MLKWSPLTKYRPSFTVINPSIFCMYAFYQRLYYIFLQFIIQILKAMGCEKLLWNPTGTSLIHYCFMICQLASLKCTQYGPCWLSEELGFKNQNAMQYCTRCLMKAYYTCMNIFVDQNTFSFKINKNRPVLIVTNSWASGDSAFFNFLLSNSHFSVSIVLSVVMGNLCSLAFILYPGLSYLIYSSTTIKTKQNTKPNTLNIFSQLGWLVCFKSWLL